MKIQLEWGLLSRQKFQPRLRSRSRHDDEYLFSSPANAERLMRAYNDALNGRNMTSMSIEDFEVLVRARIEEGR